jgi:hypothetical protein
MTWAEIGLRFYFMVAGIGIGIALCWAGWLPHICR